MIGRVPGGEYRDSAAREGGSLFEVAGWIEQASVEDHLPRCGKVPAGVYPAWSGSQ